MSRRLAPEKKAERKFTAYIKSLGGLCIKLNPFGFRGLPDRLVIMEFPIIFFLEWKREGKDARKKQKHVHKLLRGLGYGVFTVYTVEEAKEILEGYIKEHS